MKKILIFILGMIVVLSSETLFEIKDSLDRPVFSISDDGMRVINDGDTMMVISAAEAKINLDNSKDRGLSRSFSISTNTTGKAGLANILEVTTDNTIMREGVLGEEYTNFSPENIFLGLNAGASTTLGVPYSYSGMYNLFIGNYAGQFNTSGYFNTYTGYMAGNASTTATHNTFYGYQAGMNNQGGSYNSAIGYQAGYEMTGGSSNNVIGYRAGYLTSSGTDNVFIGSEAGYSNSSGDYNVALGYQAGRGLGDGNSNLFLGYQSGLNTTDGDNNIFIGYETGEANISGNNNTFMGFQAGKSNTTGNYNLFIGYSTGSLNESGQENLFIGYASGTSNVSGTGNVNLGTYSGQVATGSENVMIGRGAGCYATSANNNVFIGSYAGYGNGVNDGNVFIGYKVGYSNVGSNKLMIDNVDTANETTSLLYGDFSLDELTVNGDMHIVNRANAVSQKGLIIDTDGEGTDIPFRIRTNATPGSWTDADTKFVVWGDGAVQIGGDLTFNNTVFSIKNSYDKPIVQGGWSGTWGDFTAINSSYEWNDTKEPGSIITSNYFPLVVTSGSSGTAFSNTYLTVSNTGEVKIPTLYSTTSANSRKYLFVDSTGKLCVASKDGNEILNDENINSLKEDNINLRAEIEHLKSEIEEIKKLLK